jgi:hypothetical protein
VTTLFSMRSISGEGSRRAFPPPPFFLLVVLACLLLNPQRSPAAPTNVTGVSPAFGPTAGGAMVIITGMDLIEPTGVIFGATPATSFTVNSNTRVTATSPAEAAGTVDITVRFGMFGTPANPSDEFTFFQTTTSTPTVGEWSMLALAFLLAGAEYLRLMKAAGGRTT